jgi:hypothetical protein
MSEVTKTTIILKGSDSWDNWIEIVKSAALKAQIWTAVNPDLLDQEPTEEIAASRCRTKIVEPVMPTMANVIDLEAQGLPSDGDREMLRTLLTQYSYEVRKYEKQTSALGELRIKIQETIDESFLVYTFNCETPYEILKSLKNQFAPTDEIREQQLILVWKTYQKIKSGTEIDTWLRDWESTYDKCVIHKLAEVQGQRASYDFLDAISKIAPDFSTTWRINFASGQYKSTKELVHIFRNYRRTLKASGGIVRNAVFTSTEEENNKPTLGQQNTRPPQSNKPTPRCECGRMHFYKDCWYIHPETRPNGWKPNPNILQKVEKLLKKRPWIRTNHQKKAEDSDQETALLAANQPQTAFALTTVFKTTAGAKTVSYELKKSTILDSGATIHVCNDRTKFLDITPASGSDELLTGDGISSIQGFGTVEIKTIGDNDLVRTIKLLNTAYVPNFHTNIVSFNKLFDAGIDWDTRNYRLTYGQSQTFCKVTRKAGQWLLEHVPITVRTSVQESTFPVSSHKPRTDTLGTQIQWHQRMGHLNFDAIKHLPSVSKGVQITDEFSDRNCEVCRTADAKQKIARQLRERAPAPYERINYDNFTIERSLDDANYIHHIVDDCTRMQHVYPRPDGTQSTLIEVFDHLVNFVRTQWGFQVKIIRTDNDKALKDQFKAWASQKGIYVEFSARYTPQQNGSSERAGGVIITRGAEFRTMSNLPKILESEMHCTAAYLLNRSPTRALNWKSPIQVLNEFLEFQDPKPFLGHLRAYGCRAYALNKTRPKLARTEPRAHIGYLVGYESTNIYRIWVPGFNRVFSTRDVDFDETKFYDPSYDRQISENVRSIVSKGIELDSGETAEPEVQEPQIENTESIPEGESEIVRTSDPEQELPQEVFEPAEPDQPSYEAEENLVSDNLDTEQLLTPEPSPAPEATPTKEIGLDLDERNIIEGKRTRFRKQVYYAQLRTNSGGYSAAVFNAHQFSRTRVHRSQLPALPETWKDLEQHPLGSEFRTAGQKEFKTLIDRGTFRPFPRAQAKGREIIPLRWVFTYKFDSDGYLDKYKARLVVRGDLQRESIYEDTYAATLHARIVRSMIAIAAFFNLDIYQWDAVNAFINALLDELVFVRYPEGFDQEGMCLLLIRALYGLRRSPLLWFKDICTTLAKLGLKQVPEAQCLFISKTLIVFFYVDDIIILSHPSARDSYDKFKVQLQEAYELREIQGVNWFLGMRIVRHREEKRIAICQDAYIEKISNSFSWTTGTIPKTPLSSVELTPYEGQATAQEIYAYGQRVGSINYAAICTRPDVSFAAKKLAEFLINPGPQHLEEADRTGRYLYGTRTKAIEYSAQIMDHYFQCSSDASYADNPSTRRSTEGYLFSLFGGPIDWRCTNQKTVTTSTTEAELLALSHTAAQLYWWQRFFNEIHLNLNQEFMILCDNLQTVRLMLQDTPKLVTKLKHVDIHQHWLRQEVVRKNLQVQWIQTSEMKADGFTKALPRQKHQEFVRQLNLKDLSFPDSE